MADLTEKVIDFVNAQEMATKHPETFEAPTTEELDNIFVGDTVKVSVLGERFWCEVVEVNSEVIKARVDNDLIFTDEHGIRYMDIIQFEKKNVYSIFLDV